MSLKAVSTDKAPAAIGPYSQAVACGDLVFCSGQIPLDPQTGEMVGDEIVAQTTQALANLGEVLKASGSSRDRVVKTTVLLADMNDFAQMNAVYAEFFGEHKPARAAFQVSRLPKDALVEIEAVAKI